MTLFRHAPLLSFALLFLSFPAFAQADTAWHIPSADSLVDARYHSGAFMGIAAGASVHGVIRWTHSDGYANVEKKIPFTPTSPTPIASIAKPMTAIAIMQLVEQGRVDLDAPIQAYIPEFPKKAQGTITVRQLLQHSAGIGEYASNKERENQHHYPSLNEAMAIFQDRDPIDTPGAAFHYTTYGYVILGVVVERVSGMSYAAYMRTHIREKAGMTNTGVEEPGMAGGDHASLYHINSKGRISIEQPTDLSDRVPGGGLYSCLTDLLRFGDAVVNGTLISTASLMEMLKDPGLKKQGNGYGLGWYLYGEDPKYGSLFGHNGSQTGASTYLMLLPDRGISIVVLSNTSGAMQAVSDITTGLIEAVQQGAGQ